MAWADLVASVDRAAMAHLGGVQVIYEPQHAQDGGPVSVTGIFDEQYVLAKGGVDAGVESLGPAVFVRLSDLPTDPEHDEPTIRIGEARYRVTERKPDGMGGVVLVLRAFVT